MCFIMGFRYADLQNLQATESPPNTISLAVMVTPCQLTLDCCYLQSARSCKQNKVELSAELDCLKISNFYETLEVSVLGHYLCNEL